MYRICEKCVCFVFLVVLAVLSCCSGFRIDNLAMTDIISKKNSDYNHTSSSSSSSSSSPPSSTSLANSDDFFAKLFGAPPPRLHRLRHQRHLRHHQPQQHQIEPIRMPSPPHHQLPRPIRSQRSSVNSRHHKGRGPCPDYHPSWKAYHAQAVVVAKAESMSSHPRDNYTVNFKVLKWIKQSAFHVDDTVQLTFSRAATTNHCELDEPTTRGSRLLVRAKIDKSKEYVLFLDNVGAHKYSPMFAPEPMRKRTNATIMKVTSPNFQPKPVKLEMREKSRKPEESRLKRLKLVCKIEGLPVPLIHWRRNNTLLRPNHRVKITQKKRKSTLVIKNPSESDAGTYECETRDVTGARQSKQKNFPTDRESPCKEAMEKNYCYNAGKCFFVEMMQVYGCECATGFTGERCEKKSSEQSSRYPQTPLYTCKLGLYTKYDNC